RSLQWTPPHEKHSTLLEHLMTLYLSLYMTPRNCAEVSCFLPPHPIHFNSICGVEGAPVKLEGRLAMGPQVGIAVATRVEVKLVGNFQGFQRFVKFARAAVEAKGVLRAAIEINFHSLERWRILP